MDAPKQIDLHKDMLQSDTEAYLDSLMETEDVNDLMEKRIVQLNLFLKAFGMNCLDWGSPFDCMVLYALRACRKDTL